MKDDKQDEYRKKITDETWKKIQDYIKENPEEVVQYDTWIEGQQLKDQAEKEAYESMKPFRDDFDKIEQYYYDNCNIECKDEFNYHQNYLRYEVTKKFHELYGKFHENKQLNEALDEIKRKKYI